MTSRPRRGTRRRPVRILASGVDPYVAVLIARHLPSAEIVGTPSGDIDLAVVESADSTAAMTLQRAGAARVLALSDADGDAPDQADEQLVRPFLPSALFEALDRLLDPPHDRSIIGEPTFRGAARLAAIAMGAGVAGFASGGLRLVSIAVLAYGCLRLIIRPGVRFAHATDVLAAGALMATTGGQESPFVIFAMYAAVDAGLDYGWSWGIAAGAAIASSTALDAVGRLIGGEAGFSATAAWLLMFPFAGAVGGLVNALRRPDDPAGEMLAETNKTLTKLHSLARGMPGSFDCVVVAQACAEETKESTNAAGIAVAGYVEGTPEILASSGRVELDAAQVMETSKPGPMLHAGACMLSVPAERNGRRLGVLVVTCSNHRRHRATLSRLRPIAADMAIALENAELFERVRRVSAGHERRRLARRMHEGLAQTLTHLRLELDYIVRHGWTNEGTLREHLGAMSHVLDRAVGDVRALMDGLRSAPQIDEPIRTPGERLPA